MDDSRFENLGVVRSGLEVNDQYLDLFISEINRMKKKGSWSKEELVDLFKSGLSNFQHTDMNKSLDDKMSIYFRIVPTESPCHSHFNQNLKRSTK
jgi:hypothetical protein